MSLFLHNKTCCKEYSGSHIKENVHLWDHRVSMYLVSTDRVKIFSKVVVPVHIPWVKNAYFHVLGFVKFIYWFLQTWWVWNCSIVFNLQSPDRYYVINKVQYLSFLYWSFRFLFLELVFLGSLLIFPWRCLLSFFLPLFLSFLVPSLPSNFPLSSSFTFLSSRSPLFLSSFFLPSFFSLTSSFPPFPLPHNFFFSDCQGFVIIAFIKPLCLWFVFNLAYTVICHTELQISI